MRGPYRIVALCTSRIQDKECYEMVIELTKRISETDMRLFVFNADITDGNGNFRICGSKDVYDLMSLECIDIVLIDEEHIKSDEVTKSIIASAKEKGLPIVIIGEPHEGCLNIKFNNNGLGDIVRHLIEKHDCKRIHMMAGARGNIFSEERIIMYKETLAEYGLPFDDSMLSYGDFWSRPAAAATEKIVSSGNIPDAIVCANDDMAIATIAVLEGHGIRVPQDIIVTGFDNTDESFFCTPQLTTVIHDDADLCKALIEILDKAAINKEGTTYVDTKMLVRCSCGCNDLPALSPVDHIVELNNRFFRYQDEGIILSEAGARMQLCDNFEDMCYIMHETEMIYAMACMLKKEYVDCSNDPKEQLTKGYGDELLMLFDGDRINYLKDRGQHFSPEMILARDVMPAFDYYLQDKRCLIFNALFYHGVTLGYVAFHYSDYAIGNFLKIPQSVTTLNNAIGSFLDSRYQDYLMHRIDDIYRTDTLTELLNRRGFMTEYDELISHNNGEPLTVVLCDLDGLKEINDCFGHEEGDIAIRTVAGALRSACPENAVCTRFGGDEMLAVFPTCDYDIRERFDCILDEFNHTAEKPYTVAGSVGVLHLKENEHPCFEELIRRTDSLMYEQKRLHKAQKA